MNINFTPRIGLEFENLDEAYEFWTNYGHEMGFNVRKHNFTYSRRDKSIITCYRYVCSKQGVRQPDKRDYTIKYPRAETRTDCKAKMYVKLVNGKWRVSEFVGEHNHPLHSKESAHLLRSQRQVNATQGIEIETANDVGLKQKDTFNLMSKQVGGRANLGFTREDVKSYLRQRRQREMKYGEAGCLLQYFQQQLIENPSFFHAYQMDFDEQITNVFWADPHMLIDYACFGDVVSFDTTYCTNRQNRPLAVFSGFNHYRTAVIFGVALLYDETIESFKWLFETFLQAHKQKQPHTIFTDQDQAMARALQDVMPEVKHGLCIFHLHRNGIKHLGNLMKDGSHFLTDLNKCLFNYDEESEFEDAWRKLLSTYNLEENSWLSSIYKIKEKWAVCYMKHAFTIGMRSTQLSESVNSSLKDCMTPELDINRFLKLFEMVVHDKRYTELQQDFNTREKLPRLIVRNAPMLQQVSQIYTPAIFDVFQDEWDCSCACRIKERDEIGDVKQYVVRMITRPGEWKVTYDSTNGCTNCSCMKFQQYGLICCHALRIYTHLEVDELPKQYILKRWTREARCEIVQDILGNEIKVDPKMESSMRYRQLCPMFVRLVSEASKCQETFDIVQHAILELSKKVSDILAMRESSEDETSCKMCTKCAITAVLKKKEGKRHKRRWMSWVDNQSNKKRKVQSNHIYKGAKVLQNKPSCVLQKQGKRRQNVNSLQKPLESKVRQEKKNQKQGKKRKIKSLQSLGSQCSTISLV